MGEVLSTRYETSTEADSPYLDITYIPEDVFAERARELAALHGAWLGPDAKLLPEQLLGKICLDPSAGFPEEISAAARGTHEEYSSHLRSLARVTPNLITRHPDIFRPHFKVSELHDLLDTTLWHDSNNAHYYDRFAPHLPSDLAERYSNYVLNYAAGSLDIDKVIALNRYSGLPSGQIRSAAKTALETNKYFWQGFATPHVADKVQGQWYDYTPDMRDTFIEEACQTVTQLIEQGILTEDEISTDLLRLQRVSPNIGDSYGPTAHFAIEALCAESILIAHDVIGERSSLKERISDLGDKLQASAEHGWGVDQLYRMLVNHGVVSAEASLMQQYEQWDMLSLNERAQLASQMQEHLAGSDVAQMTHDVICAEYARMLSSGEKIKWEYAGFKYLARHMQDPGLRKQLLEQCVATRDEDTHAYIVDYLDDFTALYADDPDRLTELFSPEFEIAGTHTLFNIPVQVWMDRTGKTLEEVRQRYLCILAEGREDKDYCIEEGLAAQSGPDKVELFSEEEWIDMIVECIAESDEFYGYASMFRAMAIAFGRKGVAHLIDTLSERLPSFTAIELLKSNDLAHSSNLMDTIKTHLDNDDFDYYDKLKLSYYIDKVDRILGASYSQELADWTLKSLTTTDLSLTCYIIWPFLDDQQKEQLFERLIRNPCEAEASLTEPYIADLFRQTKLSRQLTAASSENSESFIFEREVQRQIPKKRTDATRTRLLSHYSYHAELAADIREAYGADTQDLIRTLRENKKEKAELAALELLSLLAAYTSMTPEQIKQSDKAELQQQAWRNTLALLDISTDAADRIAQQLQAENIDIIKFAKWIQTSQQSKNVTDYMRTYLEHRAAGKSHHDWKFDRETPVSVAGKVIPKVWQDEISETVQIAGKSYTIRLTHGLDAVYELGAKPTYNCLHYAHGFNRRGLISLLDTPVKVLHIENSRGSTVANAILRVVDIDGEQHIGEEPFYESLNDSTLSWELRLASTEIINRHATNMGMGHVLLQAYGDDGFHHTLPPHFEANRTRGTATIPDGSAPYGYSDAAGVSQKSLHVAYTKLVRAAVSAIDT